MYFGLSRRSEGVVGRVAAPGGVEFHGGSIPNVFRAIPDSFGSPKVEKPPKIPKLDNFFLRLVSSTWATTVEDELEVCHIITDTEHGPL